jgi:hypothetical protein
VTAWLYTWLGPLDAFLRTAAALVSYLALRWLQTDLGFNLPLHIPQLIALVIALVISGLGSRRLWRFPSLELTWESQKQVWEDETYEIRTSDPRGRNIIKHGVIAPEHSVLSWLIMNSLVKEKMLLQLHLTPRTAFDLQDEITLPGIDAEETIHGLQFTVPRLNEEGLVAEVKFVWEPTVDELAQPCRLKYRLVCATGSRFQRVLARLVKLDAKVGKVRLSS